MSEYWINIYRSGHRGMCHSTREDAETAGTPSFVESTNVGAVYRLHVWLKEVAQRPAHHLRGEAL